MDPVNIIFILIDDMGWTDLTCCGSTFYETSHLDQLAGRSVRFTNGYASCPVSSPTRASILTGQYPARVGVTNFIGGHTKGKLIDAPYTRHLPLEQVSIASALNKADYQTWHVGKWHLGPEAFWPEHHGFDVNVGGCDWGMPKQGYFAPWGHPNLSDGPDGEYLTDRLTDEAIRLLEKRDTSRPFFLNMCYYAVHTPIQAKQPIIDKYQAKARSLGLDDAETFEYGGPFPCEHKRDQQITRRLLQSDPTYAAMVESLDINIGRLMQALEQAGLGDNTAVVFTSDNGGLSTAEGAPTCNAPLCEGKGWTYEGGIREPMMIRWPGVTTEGAVNDTPVTSPDFYPTMLDMAGLDPMPQQHVDGRSLTPVLSGSGDVGSFSDRSLFWHYPHYGNQGGTPGSIIRRGRHKLIEFFEDNRLELYDLEADISETNDLANDQPDLVRDLHAELDQWRGDVNARTPEPNPDWRE